MPEYRFLVRERLTRNRIYKITASSEDDARDLLDGFKQTPKEEAAAQEKIVVDDYDIIDVDRNDPQIGEKVLLHNGKFGKVVNQIDSFRYLVSYGKGTAILYLHSDYAWDEDAQHWYRMGKSNA